MYFGEICVKYNHILLLSQLQSFWVSVHFLRMKTLAMLLCKSDETQTDVWRAFVKKFSLEQLVAFMEKKEIDLCRPNHFD